MHEHNPGNAVNLIRYRGILIGHDIEWINYYFVICTIYFTNELRFVRLLLNENE